MNGCPEKFVIGIIRARLAVPVKTFWVIPGKIAGRLAFSK